MKKKIVSLLRKRPHGLGFQGIVRGLQLRPKDRALLKKKLTEMERDGTVLRYNRKYTLPPKSQVVVGVFLSNPKGYGFVTPEGDPADDIFIPSRHRGGAVHGDRVEIFYQDKGIQGKPEGRVLRILKKEKTSLLGVCKWENGNSFFVPFDAPYGERMPIRKKNGRGPGPGTIVEVERTSGRMIRILGTEEDPGVDTEVIISRYALPFRFGPEAEQEAAVIPDEIGPDARLGRKDFKEWTTVTIDGSQAKDFDDAVSVKKLPGGFFLLGVHIADVSTYVHFGSPLDKEAFKRGTSVYFPDRTLPMLPEKLSNHVCSLRPDEEKLTLTVLLKIDREGNIVHSEFFPSLIRTAARLTYESVYKIFLGDREEQSKYHSLVPDLMNMRELASLLRGRRISEGSLDFDLLEPELVYKEGNLQSVIPFEANEAHHLIEDFMVAANEAVASFLCREGIPSLFRIHPPPDIRKLKELREMLQLFNISLPKQNVIRSRDLQRVLEEAEEKDWRKFIHLQVLKSLRLAVYSNDNIGHYGLAREMYTHFTSPIRRYPDLVVHRILKSVLSSRKPPVLPHSELARSCSQKERNAEQAENDLLEWRIYRLLKKKLGEVLKGIFMAITKAGMAVELKDYFVEGMVFYKDMGGDYYETSSPRTLIGRKTRKKYQLGQNLDVQLVSVDPVLRRIRLIPMGVPE
ncbi:MAG: ribonuclease R [Candidatus Aminicenantes bacterium]|nr:ribonuclease R [Candidatus Aminicenantes bacterium]